MYGTEKMYEESGQIQQEFISESAEITAVKEASQTRSGLFCVDIRMLIGGVFREVPYHGMFGFDLADGDYHGVWIPPKEGMYVLCSFLRGKTNMPRPIATYPLPSRAQNDALYRKYHKNLKKDVIGLYNKKNTIELKTDKVEIKQKDGKVIITDSTGTYIGAEGATKKKVVSYEDLSDYLQTVVGNLGAQLFPTGLPESVAFQDFFGGKD